MRRIIFSISFLLFAWLGFAQPSQQLYTVVVQPDREDWVYKVGQEAEFEIYVTHNKVPVSGITVSCEYGPEAMPAVKKMELEIKNDRVKFKVPGLKAPGFQTVRARVEINGKRYSSYTNIGYEPEKIQPTQIMPVDFKEFWDKAKDQAARIPLNSELTLQPNLCTSTLNVYHIRFNNNAYGSYIYGMLCVPKKEGKYPAVLQLPGSGLHSFSGYKTLADHGVITLEIGVHGIPVNMPQEVYSNLASGALKGYSRFNMEDRDAYYMKRVYIGCQRGIEFLCSLDNVDTSNVAVMGGSQGGALSIVTAALDSRVKCFASRHPGACDVTGALHGRPAGSPAVKDGPTVDLQVKTSQYYDVVNFARTLTVPGYYTWGFNDPACCPTTTFSAFNVVTAPKTLNTFQETAHWHFPEQNVMYENWVLEQLGVK